MCVCVCVHHACLFQALGLVLLARSMNVFGQLLVVGCCFGCQLLLFLIRGSSGMATGSAKRFAAPKISWLVKNILYKSCRIPQAARMTDSQMASIGKLTSRTA